MAQTMARMAESGRAKIKEVGIFVMLLKKEKKLFFHRIFFLGIL